MRSFIKGRSLAEMFFMRYTYVDSIWRIQVRDIYMMRETRDTSMIWIADFRQYIEYFLYLSFYLLNPIYYVIIFVNELNTTLGITSPIEFRSS